MKHDNKKYIGHFDLVGTKSYAESNISRVLQRTTDFESCVFQALKNTVDNEHLAYNPKGDVHYVFSDSAYVEFKTPSQLIEFSKTLRKKLLLNSNQPLFFVGVLTTGKIDISEFVRSFGGTKSGSLKSFTCGEQTTDLVGRVTSSKGIGISIDDQVIRAIKEEEDCPYRGKKLTLNPPVFFKNAYSKDNGRSLLIPFTDIAIQEGELNPRIIRSIVSAYHEACIKKPSAARYYLPLFNNIFAHSNYEGLDASVFSYNPNEERRLNAKIDHAHRTHSVPDSQITEELDEIRKLKYTPFNLIKYDLVNKHAARIRAADFIYMGALAKILDGVTCESSSSEPVWKNSHLKLTGDAILNNLDISNLLDQVPSAVFDASYRSKLATLATRYHNSE
ncbi:MAG: hypothetical protein WC661_01390 [Opitutaceae bacterium]|jgi:hypothetical protein